METRKNKLFLGGMSAEELVREFGSPLYVYEEDMIRQRFDDLDKNITYPDKKIYYACKANTNPAIMRIVLEKGGCIDAVSPYEAEMALRVGFSPDRILFTGDNATDEDLQFCIKRKIMVNLGSLSQIERYGRLCRNSNISIRINPDVGAGHHGHCITGGPDSKFGIYFDRVDEIRKTAAKYGLGIAGIHSHIGSGILDTAIFKKAMNMVLDAAKGFSNLEFVDFGGGIGVPYRPDERPMDIRRFGREISALFEDFCRQYGKQLMMIIEPGRYIVAEAGFLLVTTNNRKHTPKHTFIGTDSGFNHLIRPTMYGSYHDIINASNVEGEKEKVVIAGNICESGDVFTRNEDGPEDRQIARITEGDVLAICNAGAYGFSMSSNYNTRPRPAEVIVSNGKARIIRRRETFEDITRTAVMD
ncbi:diaminopimelate decarboxylase [Candidatus Woesearchaeota archaeon CG10_big_fil_rev_8_21_14_0_10_44_13]|nr:MAG: diaminopimelate decarboxylase [Candidatus Woesearchaeota archaeon CG10_big_fil_rev_8_21_14_0_10_44_13]